MSDEPDVDPAIPVQVNGQPRQVAPRTAIADLLSELGLPATGVAVALDGRVVPRSEHPTTVLVAGSAVEILRAVGGG